MATWRALAASPSREISARTEVVKCLGSDLEVPAVGTVTGVELTISEQTADLGEVSVGCSETLSIDARNTGTEELVIQSLELTNHLDFTLEDKGEFTNVTWAIHGPCPYISKLIGIFVNMDRMIGRDFEVGLANLKAVAEQ